MPDFHSCHPVASFAYCAWYEYNEVPVVDSDKMILNVGEWINIRVGETELRFRFDGFSPVQDKGVFGKVVMMQCSFENLSEGECDVRNFFRGTVRIIDAEGFSIPNSSSRYGYGVYDWNTSIDGGEKKRIVETFCYDGDVSDLTAMLIFDEND